MLTRQNLLVFLFGACLVQGLFLAPIVANLPAANRRATRALALMILCFVPMLGEQIVSTAGLSARFPHAIGSSITIDFLLGPLIFFYARNLMHPDALFSRRDLRHFIPFTLAVLVMLPYFALTGSEKLAAVRDGLPLSFQIVIAAKIVVAAVYLTVVITRLRGFVRSEDPRAHDPNIVWVLRMMIVLAGVAVLSVLIGLLQNRGLNVPIDSDTLGILFICASIYTISALLIRHPLSGMAAQMRRKYETSPLGDVRKQEYLDRLVQHMELKRPYLDMTLDMPQLAAALDVRPGHLSQILNERLGMNFYEFVNSYRIREAQLRIAEGDSNKTLLSIAFESGFNSKASFNRAFKRFTGKTPSEYARSTAGRQKISAN